MIKMVEERPLVSHLYFTTNMFVGRVCQDEHQEQAWQGWFGLSAFRKSGYPAGQT